MDIYFRKIESLQHFLKIENENLLSDLEKILFAYNTNILKSDFKPMSKEDLNKRIDQSMLDSKANCVISHDDLLNEIETWH